MLCPAVSGGASAAANAVSPSKSNKAVRYGNIFIFCSHYHRSKAIRRAVDLPDRSFDLMRPVVAPPLPAVSVLCRRRVFCLIFAGFQCRACDWLE